MWFWRQVDSDHVSIMLFAMFLAQIRRCSLVVPVGGTWPNRGRSFWHISYKAKRSLRSQTSLSSPRSNRLMLFEKSCNVQLEGRGSCSNCGHTITVQASTDSRFGYVLIVFSFEQLAQLMALVRIRKTLQHFEEWHSPITSWCLQTYFDLFDLAANLVLLTMAQRKCCKWNNQGVLHMTHMC